MITSSNGPFNHMLIHPTATGNFLLDAFPAAIYTCDAEGYVTYFNEAAATLWGRRPEIGKDLWCGSWKIYYLNGEPMPLEACPMAQALKHKKPITGKEIIVEKPDGERLIILPHPLPLFDEKNTLIGAVNMLVDITDQVNYRNLKKHTDFLTKTLDALRRSEERYHRMVSEVQDYAIILLSRDGTIENWNLGAEKIKGYPEAEALGKHIRVFYTPEDQQRFLPEKLIQTALESGKANHEGWRVRKDGSRFWGLTSITALHNKEGAVIGFSKVTRDLTERRNYELQLGQINEDLTQKNEMLRLSEERYHRMVAEVEDYVIILLDIQGNIQNWNKGAQKIKGYGPEEVIGKHFRMFYAQQDQNEGLPEKLLSKASRNGKAIHEGWRLRKNGSAFWGSVVITALHNEEGDVIGFTKVTRDLTAKKRAEEKLMRTSFTLEQRNKELHSINEQLTSFAYICSHDLQEPLRKIQTFSDRLIEVEYENLSDRGRDYLMRVQSGASRMQKLIRDILAYSRTTTHEAEAVVSELDGILTLSRQELEVKILEKNAVFVCDPLPRLKVIPIQMQQLFTNLLSNALKFSRPGVDPRIEIRSELIDVRSVPTAPSAVYKNWHHISIRDNGIGFEPEYAKKIFEVFQRLHGKSEYDGTGIGLAICRKIVENHQGILTAQGTPGEGSTFHMYLPVTDE